MDGCTDSHMSDSDGFHPNITAGRSPAAVKLFINACYCLPVMMNIWGDHLSVHAFRERKQLFLQY